MADHFFETFGEVGLLVNNAGIGGGGYIGETCLEDWEKVARTDFFGGVYGCHAFVGRMKAQGAGHIVNTASMAGLFAIPGFAPYNSSKAAVVALTETLRVELAPYNIGASVLCPSMIATNIVSNSLKVTESESYEDASWGIELLSVGMEQSSVGVEDVARLVLHAVEKDRLFIITRFSARLSWLNARLSPELYYRMIAFLHRKGLARLMFMWAARKGLA
jgi:NAD(P)-dependent dehydrogenase (short-subunit alcohol dehydrogenase family)